MANRQPGSEKGGTSGLFSTIPSLAGDEVRSNESGRPVRIYFVGAHATGKTTLARYVSDRYGLKLISEVARSILAEMEIGLDRLRSNIDTVNRYQVAVFRRQIEAERNAGDSFVSDRAFCNLAYTANHATVMHELFRDPALEEYMRWVAAGLVFFVRPHPDLIQNDGVRAALRWEDVVLIDGMVKLLLEMYAIPYIILSVLSMQERVRMVDEVIRLRYPELALRQPTSSGNSTGSVPRLPRIYRPLGEGDAREARAAPRPSTNGGVEVKPATRPPQAATRDHFVVTRGSRPRGEGDEVAAARSARPDMTPES
jgi:predicted ATPase